MRIVTVWLAEAKSCNVVLVAPIELRMFEALKEGVNEQPNIETYTFEEFLLCSPQLPRKNV